MAYSQRREDILASIARAEAEDGEADVYSLAIEHGMSGEKLMGALAQLRRTNRQREARGSLKRY
jgi:hypothetical protein